MLFGKGMSLTIVTSVKLFGNNKEREVGIEKES